MSEETAPKSGEHPVTTGELRRFTFAEGRLALVAIVTVFLGGWGVAGAVEHVARSTATEIIAGVETRLTEHIKTSDVTHELISTQLREVRGALSEIRSELVEGRRDTKALYDFQRTGRPSLRLTDDGGSP